MRYICMPRVQNTPHRPLGARLTTCPQCSVTCWDKPLPGHMQDLIENGRARKVCTECAIRRVTGKQRMRAIRRQDGRCG
jgi:hypothetical protein